MPIRLLVDTKGDRACDAFLAQWVQQRIPRCMPFGDPVQQGYRGMGIIMGDDLVAAAIYSDIVRYPGGGGNVYITFAADAPRKAQGGLRTRRQQGIGAPHWATRESVNFILGMPFLQFGVNRITALIDCSFTSSRKLVTHVGFKQEGKIRQVLPGKRDAIVYGLLKEDFLNGRFAQPRAPIQEPPSSAALAA